MKRRAIARHREAAAEAIAQAEVAQMQQLQAELQAARDRIERAEEELQRRADNGNNIIVNFYITIKSISF